MTSAGLIALVFRDAPVALREYVKQEFESRGLVVEMETAPDEDGRVVAEINAGKDVIASEAEEFGLGKATIQGEVKPFKVALEHEFVGAGEESMFTEAERIMLIWQIINEIHPNENLFQDIEGKENLLRWLLRNGHAEDCFPIHNAETVAGFLQDMSILRPWLSEDLIERFRDYFGDRAALYYAFMSTYTTCLLTYATIGLVVFVLSLVPAIRPLVLLIFAVFSPFWSTWMLQSWYQRNIKLIYDWRGIVLGDQTDEKLFEKSLLEDFRDEFQGELKPDEITGEMRPTASKEDSSRRFIFSNCMIMVFFLISARAIFACFSFEDSVNAWLADEDDEYVFLKVFPLTLVFQNIPMVVFIVTMMILNGLFTSVASKLTNYENHQLKRDYSVNLTRKLTIFQFLNTFGVFLYIAFIRKNAAVLKARITNLFVVELIMGNLKETLIPILKRAYERIQKKEKTADYKRTDGDPPVSAEATAEENSRGAVEQSDAGEKVTSSEVSAKITNGEAGEKSTNGEAGEKIKGSEASESAAESVNVETIKAKVKKFTSKPFLKSMWEESKKELIVSSKQSVEPISVRDQLELDDAEDNLDEDYFEMYRQLGIINLFAVVTPIAPALAAVNDCVEIYTDVLKMVRNTKRTIPCRDISIGAWYDAMQTLSLLSFMTNLLLFFHTTGDGSLLFQLKSTDLYLLMVFMEHVLLTVRATYVNTTSTTPEAISNTRAKKAFLESRAI